MGLLVRIIQKAESGNRYNGILSWFLLYENQDNKVKFHNKKSDINNNNIEHSEFQRIDNVEDFNDTLSREEIITKLGRKYKKNLVSIAKLLKHINYNQCCLSQTQLSKSLGYSQDKVSKIIKKLIDIKVLRVIDNSYSYIEHTSKVYQVNQNMISIIYEREYLLQDNIEIGILYKYNILDELFLYCLGKLILLKLHHLFPSLPTFWTSLPFLSPVQ